MPRVASASMRLPRTRAYHEIWYGEERVASSEPEEPFLGKQYLPRKFKIGFVIPPENDVDVFTQDLGFIAIAEDGKLRGFNVTIGGGMGRTDQALETYPRLGDVIGFIPNDRLIVGDRRGHRRSARSWRPQGARPCAVQIYDRRSRP